MARVKTFTNGGSLLPGDLNSIQDDYEFGFSTYKDLLAVFGGSQVASTAGTYILGFDASGAAFGTMVALPAGAPANAFYFDPADRTANTRANKYRVRAQAFTNAVAPATNWTVGLYPIATWGGASSAGPTIATVGTVVAGSTVAFNAPGATSQNQGNSGDLTAPAAGWYCFAVVNSGAAAAGSCVGLRATLQLRQV